MFFTRVVRVLVSWARLQGIRFHAYLDVCLILAASRDICLDNLTRVLEITKSFGFVVSESKSNLIPAPEFLSLGIVLNTVEWTVNTGEKRINSLCFLFYIPKGKRVISGQKVVFSPKSYRSYGFTYSFDKGSQKRVSQAVHCTVQFVHRQLEQSRFPQSLVPSCSSSKDLGSLVSNRCCSEICFSLCRRSFIEGFRPWTFTLGFCATKIARKRLVKISYISDSTLRVRRSAVSSTLAAMVKNS